MATYVGLTNFYIPFGSPHNPSSNTMISQLRLFPQGTSPKLAQKQFRVLLSKSVTSGLVIMIVLCASPIIKISPISLSILVDIISKNNSKINVKLAMEMLISTLLRPYRSTYSNIDLGKKRTETYIRHDGSVYNERELLLQYSFYENLKKSDVCLVYCHCNSGSRIQGVQYLQLFIDKGWNVCLFDFSGSGQSQGDFISLGHYQSKDLECVLRKMRQLGNRKFLLWGRSMGAATIIFYLNESKFRDDIIACILDSPYASLWQLIKQIGQSRSILPSFIIQRVLDFVRDRVKEDHLFDIKQLQPLKYIPHIDQPILYITSLMDQCVKSQDVVQLYKASGSKTKQLEYIDKAHNSARDKITIQLAINFLYKNLNERMKRKKQLKIFVKNNRDLTGANMADLILKVEKEKDQFKRMKSQHNFEPSKENKNCSNRHHIKTQFFTAISANLSNTIGKASPVKREKRKTIKFSLAHLQYKKIAENRKGGYQK